MSVKKKHAVVAVQKQDLKPKTYEPTKYKNSSHMGRVFQFLQYYRKYVESDFNNYSQISLSNKFLILVLLFYVILSYKPTVEKSFLVIKLFLYLLVHISVQCSHILKKLIRIILI